MAALLVGGVVAGASAVGRAQVVVDPDEVPGVTTPTTLDAPQVPEGLLDPLGQLAGEVTDVLDPPPEEDDGEPGEDPGTDPGEPGPDSDPAPTSTTTVPPVADEAEQPEAAERDGADGVADDGTEEPPEPVEAAFVRHLAVTAHLAAGAASPPPAVAAVTPFPGYDSGFIDIRRGPRSTAELFELLASVRATPGDVARVVAPFPVAGRAQYGNDWGAPRHTPSFHRHQGTDVFASRGTPVLSATTGVVTKIGAMTAVGGNSVRVTSGDGTYLYYAHLDGFADGIRDGALVETGTTLGYVGSTGNAEGGAPHLHFEIHPGGGGPVPPLPYLDAWLAQALEKARVLVGSGGSPAPGHPGGSTELAFGTPALATPAAFPHEDDSVVPGLVMLAAMLAGAFVWWRRRRAAAWLRSRSGPVVTRIAGVIARVVPTRRRPPTPTIDILDALVRVQQRSSAPPPQRRGRAAASTETPRRGVRVTRPPGRGREPVGTPR